MATRRDVLTAKLKDAAMESSSAQAVAAFEYAKSEESQRYYNAA